jgi:hypothetical protein
VYREQIAGGVTQQNLFGGIAAIPYPLPGICRSRTAIRHSDESFCGRVTSAVRREIDAPVYCWLPQHRTVCFRHRRWIGAPARHWVDQRHLDHHTAILTAARKHRVAHERLGADVVELPGGHSPFLSRPRVLADVLARIADGLAQPYNPIPL